MAHEEGTDIDATRWLIKRTMTGVSQRDISRELGVHQSVLSRNVRHARRGRAVSATLKSAIARICERSG